MSTNERGSSVIRQQDRMNIFYRSQRRVFGLHSVYSSGADDEKEPEATRRSHFEVLSRESTTDPKVVEVSTLSLHRNTHPVLFHFQAASHPRSRAHLTCGAQVLVLSGFVCNFSRVFRDYNLTTPATKRSWPQKSMRAPRQKPATTESQRG